MASSPPKSKRNMPCDSFKCYGSFSSLANINRSMFDGVIQNVIYLVGCNFDTLSRIGIMSPDEEMTT